MTLTELLQNPTARQVAMETAVVFSALLANAVKTTLETRSKNKTVKTSAQKLAEEQRKLEQDRQQFEREQVRFLVDHSKFLTAEIKRLNGLLETSSKDQVKTRAEMHVLAGQVKAAHALYSEILEKAKAREKKASSEAVEEEGKKADLLDRTKITIPKERKDES